MNVRWTKWTSLAAAGALGFAALTACGAGREAAGEQGGCSPGITDTEIKIGQSSLQSGPGAIYKSLVDASHAVFDEVNAAGGVKMGDGKTRKIEYISLDDGYDPARSVVNVRRLVEQDRVAAFYSNTGTSSIQAYLDYTTKAGIPLLLSAGSPSNDMVAKYRSGEGMFALSTNPTAAFENKVMVEGIRAGDPAAKIAILYSNEDTGKGQLENVRKLVEGTGLRIVGVESYETTAPTIDSQVTSLRATNADVFLHLGSGSLVTMALKKINELGWRPEKWITSANVVVQLIEAAGAGAGDDLHSISWLKSGNIVGADADPAIRKYAAWAKERGADPNDSLYFAGTLTANFLIQVLRATNGCTSKAIYDTARTMKLTTDFALPGITIGASETDPSYVRQAVTVTYDASQKGWVPGDRVYSIDK
ncbi:branched-chain amino acid transport system substrate-binding protein [Thermocatellispora tengchongensis]|uniref:Branched-chain amino acid transport system substrate-binding protein n=1 Tax=Thermocatellispora tengchongensis TaxID=1073253 RepID=A0A840PDX8_9ACTN|nr:ABC transporter substrate-binding protein [Thermocatellispora tengchongensis]MBB5136051.1 branched-chain amino acid transport system substrate-binding protein [Thermocatellispora tengchongensis]